MNMKLRQRQTTDQRIFAGLLCVLTILLMPTCVVSEELVIHPQAAPGPLDNPLKGWCPYTDAGEITQPYSMVFQYVPWSRLEPREGEYRFKEWDAGLVDQKRRQNAA